MGGNPNICSTDGTNGSMCSVLNQTNPMPGQMTTTDVCSVVTTGQGPNVSNAKCTVVNGNGGTGQCSAFAGTPPNPVANQMQCSVITPTGFNGPNANGVCQVP